MNAISPSGGRGPSRAAALLLALSSLLACRESAPTGTEGAITTEHFVAVYIDLRMAALRSGTDQLPLEQRDDILDRHGVTEDDLLRFVEVHGQNAQLMHAIWDSIQSRIDHLRVPLPDSLEG
jgi:hypothetical protein